MITQSILNATSVELTPPKYILTQGGVPAVTQNLSVELDDGSTVRTMIYLAPSCAGYEEALIASGHKVAQ